MEKAEKRLKAAEERLDVARMHELATRGKSSTMAARTAAKRDLRAAAAEYAAALAAMDPAASGRTCKRERTSGTKTAEERLKAAEERLDAARAHELDIRSKAPEVAEATAAKRDLRAAAAEYAAALAASET